MFLTQSIPAYGVGGGGQHLITYLSMNLIMHLTTSLIISLSAYLTTELRGGEAYGAQYKQKVAEHRGTT